MSVLAVNSVTDANGGNTATINTFTPTESNMMGKNRIINGDMRIDQRNAGAAVTATGLFPVDRFPVTHSSDGAFSAQQDSSAPAGFNNSVKFTVTTADASIGATQILLLRQFIEGNNIADLGWGTANAKTVTLSFWVRSSVTGTFGGSIGNNANDRYYSYSYSISSADTWEYKTVTIAGDTSGTWLTDTGIGIRVYFSLTAGADRVQAAGSWQTTGGFIAGSTGQVQLLETLNATWYITGVQLEVGSVATPFERRPYGTELALCQRYFQYAIDARQNVAAGILASCYTSTLAIAMHRLIVPMRTAPTLTNTAVNGFALVGNNTASTTSVISLTLAGTEFARIDATASGMVQGGGCFLAANAGTSVPNISLSSEL
jgi:hypothetical protein